MFLEGEREEHAIWVSGSANPSAPGWALSTANVEAGVLFRGVAARKASIELGFNALSELPPLSDEDLMRVVARTTAVEPLGGADHAAFLVGIASEDRSEIRIDSPAIRKLATSDEDYRFSAGVSVHSNAENVLTPEAAWDNGTLVLGFQEPLPSVNLLRLSSGSGFEAWILVHHPESVKKHSSSSAQRQIIDAIGSFDDSSADLSEILAVVTKVIFSENTEELLRHAEKVRHTGSTRVSGEAIEKRRPETLEAEFPAKRDKQKKSRLLSHGDLVELIDALKQKLYVAPPVGVERPADGTGGPEDGNGLGVHGAGGGVGDKPNVPPAVTDLQIALAVATKSRTLVNRMVAREKTVAEQYSKIGMESNDHGLAPARALIMQLVAVIGLLREIKRLENGPRWSDKGLKLLDPKSLSHLFENSMTYLFRADFEVADRARSGDAIYAEVEQLLGLMAWLSWVCGFDFHSPVAPRYELGAEEHTRQLHSNGYLSRLMPLVVDADCIDDLLTAIENTTARSPSAKVNATEWLNRNSRWGEQVFEVITAPSSKLLDHNPQLVEGGLAWIPGASGQFAVVSQIGPATVRLWDLGRERGFGSSYVKPLAL